MTLANHKNKRIAKGCSPQILVFGGPVLMGSDARVLVPLSPEFEWEFGWDSPLRPMAGQALDS